VPRTFKPFLRVLGQRKWGLFGIGQGEHCATEFALTDEGSAIHVVQCSIGRLEAGLVWEVIRKIFSYLDSHGAVRKVQLRMSAHGCGEKQG
jgi:hypothetical protein